jgi:hypothetical protein
MKCGKCQPKGMRGDVPSYPKDAEKMTTINYMYV